MQLPDADDDDDDFVDFEYDQDGRVVGILTEPIDFDRLPAVRLNRYVGISNALNNASSFLTLSEKRLLCLAISQLDSRAPVPSKRPTVFVNAAAYAELFDLDLTTAYEQLEKVANALFGRSIDYYVPVAVAGTIQQKPATVKTRWVDEIAYHRERAWVHLSMSRSILPHLMDLKANFTVYKLSQASDFRSVYTWRLFELLAQHKSEGRLTIPIDKFRHVMAVPPRYEHDFRDTRHWVIEPAVEELNTRAVRNLAVEFTKSGRKVTKLTFTFEPWTTKVQKPPRLAEAAPLETEGAFYGPYAKRIFEAQRKRHSSSLEIEGQLRDAVVREAATVDDSREVLVEKITRACERYYRQPFDPQYAFRPKRLLEGDWRDWLVVPPPFGSREREKLVSQFIHTGAWEKETWGPKPLVEETDLLKARWALVREEMKQFPRRRSSANAPNAQDGVDRNSPIMPTSPTSMASPLGAALKTLSEEEKSSMTQRAMQLGEPVTITEPD